MKTQLKTQGKVLGFSNRMDRLSYEQFISNRLEDQAICGLMVVSSHRHTFLPISPALKKELIIKIKGLRYFWAR
ncbi:hypothetical protein Ccur_12780 [Cryptobacterium curtum DSM 15641]|uniref:Uncharacterized protein n=1 Tax=Cryptobacterium curtum (strain ATCC 700683 / DSM 15641 / CCUG 43107 / 12-3) TaxID=469378 RepID=C7ML10_CRYCD|nr:hypothetical protein Ccur_12780 [Cryptobacterium curtum DSM 15641]